MTEEHVCASCGAALPPGAPEGSVCTLCAEATASLELAETIATAGATPMPSSPTSSLRAQTQPLFEKIGDFEVLEKLGQGGMGAVYRARQVSLDRLVALKILPSQFEEDEDFVGRFRREATVAASLNHPNLVRVYSSGQADGVHYIAMELVEGENLRQFLKRTGAMAPADALRICLQVARGLQCGWQKAQLIHRDIKPSNIYLALNGEVKVGDLGLAKSLLSNTTGITHTGTAIGTPHYVSPEQARGEKAIDCRADIYSLGCTLYELLTAATPYQGSDPLTIMTMHLNSPPPAILKVLPQCPVPVGRLVSKMLRKGRHERHQNYDELIAAMEAALDQLERPATGPSAVVEAWKAIGKAEQGFLPARGTSLTRPSAESSGAKSPAASIGKPAAPRKGWIPFVGISAAVLLLAALAFIFLRREEPLPTNRANMAAQRSASRNPDVTSEPAQSDASKASAAISMAPATGVVAPDVTAVKIFDPATMRPDKAYRHENGALRIDGSAVQSPEPHKNVALRTEVLMSPESRNPQIAVRSRTGQGAGSYYALIPLAATQKLALDGWVDGERKSLGSWPLPREYAPDEWLPIELRVIEDEITLSAAGAVVATIRDASVPGPGGLKLFAATAGYFRNTEYVPLDGLPPAAARLASPLGGRAGAGLAPGAESSAVKLWDSAEKLPANIPEATWENGAIRLYRKSLTSGEFRASGPDGAIRASIRMNPENGSSELGLRGDGKPPNDVRYVLEVSTKLKSFAIKAVQGTQPRVLQTWPWPRPYGSEEWIRVELRAQGAELTALVDGKPLGVAVDHSIANGGYVSVFALGTGYFRDIEYVPLQSESTPAPAASR